MRDKDDLDLLLDSALSTYADPGPQSRLEERVLASLAAARTPSLSDAPRRRHWLPWAVALSMAACLLVLWLETSRTDRKVSPQPQQVREIEPAPRIPSNSASAGLIPNRNPKRRAQATRPSDAIEAANRTPLPKLDVFPTPHPLTPEERGLATVATEAPMSMRKALLEAQTQDDAPVRIAAIHIPPLEPSDQDQPSPAQGQH